MSVVVQVVFALIATLIIGSAVMVVTVRNVIHSALWLIACFFGVGALYLLLEAEFLAVVQVLIYVGAISILILFAIMLTRDIDNAHTRQLTNRWWLALLGAGGLFAFILVPTLLTAAWPILAPLPSGTAPPVATVEDLGVGLIQSYVLQFEVAGFLLLVALIGAIVIAFEERARRRRVLTLAEQHALRQAEQAAQATPATGGSAAEPAPPQAQD